MEEEILKQFMSVLTNGSWVVFSGLGIFLGYKLAMTSVISYSVIKVATRLMDCWERKYLRKKRFMSLITAANMTYPLTDKEWEILINRVKQEK